MNIIQIAGHLGNDPEVRFTSSGQKVTTFRVAARTRKGKDGDDTIWWRVTVWGDRFDNMMQYLKKGSPIIVMGEVRKPEIFTNRDGMPQVSMEITAEILRFSPFGTRNNAEGNQNANMQQGGYPQQQQQQNMQNNQGYNNNQQQMDVDSGWTQIGADYSQQKNQMDNNNVQQNTTPSMDEVPF